MIWATQRNTELGQPVARFYEPAEGVPCERQAMMIGGLPGADKPSALARAGVDPSRYVTVSVNAELLEMAARGLIPRVDGLSPLEAADLAHGEAQFLVKRIAMRVCVPKTSSTSCDQAIFVDQATDVSVFSDAVLVEADRFGQRLQRRGAVQGAVRPGLVVVA